MEARSGPSDQAKGDDTILDPMLEGQIDRFVMNNPEIDTTDFMLT